MLPKVPIAIVQVSLSSKSLRSAKAFLTRGTVFNKKSPEITRTAGNPESMESQKSSAAQ